MMEYTGIISTIVAGALGAYERRQGEYPVMSAALSDSQKEIADQRLRELAKAFMEQGRKSDGAVRTRELSDVVRPTEAQNYL
ncbi:TPA: hypothetical protein HA265_07495 [Candidatus Woesearchaeota archaeon]|nr:hypothetical protein [Candidatus Woesearchaeota archaeon]